MFDNPQKELERLQEQLLAAERHDPVDDFEDEFMDESEADDVLDDELYAVLYDDQKLSRRSAGFDIQDEVYTMDTDRYVPAPKKKGIGRLLFILLLEILAAAVLIAWWLGWLS